MATSSSDKFPLRRYERALSIRQPLLRLADALCGTGTGRPLKRVRQLLWSKAFGHMRPFPSGVRFHPRPGAGWDLSVSAPAGRGRIATTCGLDDLGGRFEGKALIVASGPSAGELDFATIPEEVRLVAVNGSTEVLKASGRKADLYVATDPDFFQHRMEIVREAVRDADLSVLSFMGLAYLAKADPDLVAQRAGSLVVIEPVGRYYLVKRMEKAELADWVAGQEGLTLGAAETPLTGRVGWSDDLRLGVFTARTIAYTALQVTTGLGFGAIGLIGADFTAGGRAYDEADGARPTQIADDFDRVIAAAFHLGRQCCEKRDIKIYNLAANSRLREVLETSTSEHFLR